MLPSPTTEAAKHPCFGALGVNWHEGKLITAAQAKKAGRLVDRHMDSWLKMEFLDSPKGSTGLTEDVCS